MKGKSKAQSHTSPDTTELTACSYLLLYLSVEQNDEKKLREVSNTLVYWRGKQISSQTDCRSSP